MAKYFKDKNKIFVAPDNATDILDELPNRVYSLNFHIMTGFYLELVDSFETPDHIYGDIEEDARKVISTYHHRKTNTGVLLSGEKGSGKTMTARLISKICADQNIPTIIINNNFEEDFCKFISDINQKCVIIFDEFEKVFSRDEEQPRLLTLFDGTYTSNKLLLLTANDLFKVNDFFINRPGRIYYHIKYESLEDKFITEFCEKNLDNKAHIDSIVNLSRLIQRFNFDMLQTIVHECNLHKESPQEAYRLLNIDHSSSSSQYKFEIIDTRDNRKYTGKAHTKLFSNEVFYFRDYINETYNDDDDDDDITFPGAVVADEKSTIKEIINRVSYVSLSQSNFIAARNGTYEFKDKYHQILMRKDDSHNFTLAF